VRFGGATSIAEGARIKAPFFLFFAGPIFAVFTSNESFLAVDDRSE